jgi:hypothetical protein
MVYSTIYCIIANIIMLARVHNCFFFETRSIPPFPSTVFGRCAPGVHRACFCGSLWHIGFLAPRCFVGGQWCLLLLEVFLPYERRPVWVLPFPDWWLPQVFCKKSSNLCRKLAASIFLAWGSNGARSLHRKLACYPCCFRLFVDFFVGDVHVHFH